MPLRVMLNKRGGLYNFTALFNNTDHVCDLHVWMIRNKKNSCGKDLCKMLTTNSRPPRLVIQL